MYSGLLYAVLLALGKVGHVEFDDVKVVVDDIPRYKYGVAIYTDPDKLRRDYERVIDWARSAGCTVESSTITRSEDCVRAIEKMLETIEEYRSVFRLTPLAYYLAVVEKAINDYYGV